MKLHRGRMIDHVHLRTADLPASSAFYAATLDMLGIEHAADDDHFQADELWIDRGDPVSKVHLAFQAADRATVDKWYNAGLKAGGRDNGAPGERDYHPCYYAAFLLDPDGNNIEAVHHGAAERSAASVEIDFDMPA